MAITKWPEKNRVREALLEQLRLQMAQVSEAARRTREAATHEEAKPENDKDTRALEQSYLARGQAMRVEDLAEQIQTLRFLPLPTLDDRSSVQLGALVALEVDDAMRMIWLAPYAGGAELSVDDHSILVVTGGSPLGQALLGKSTGDDFTLRIRGAQREHVIVGVR